MGREFDIVPFKDLGVIAGRFSNYSKEDFIKKVKEEFEIGGLQIIPSTYEEKFGRVLNPFCGRDFQLDEKSARGNFPVHCVSFILRQK